MSDSDGPKRWPAVERRSQGERRASTGPAARRRPERRSGGDRRADAGWEPVPLEGEFAEADPGAALLAAATIAREHARARYSGFKVGAALQSADGQVITGCNIENATYGLTLCAERVALVKALSDGHGLFTRIAVVADTDELTPPCGACRQLLWEYCGDLDIMLGNLVGQTARYRLSALLPLPFDARLL